MDFSYDSEHVAFRKSLRQFIEAELPEWWRGLFSDHHDGVIEFTREFCAKLAERGWLIPAWPEEFGGEGTDPWMQMVVREEMWARGEPRGPQYMNLNYIGPMIMRFGTDEQKRMFLPPMAAGQVIWCQGFSEPEAGSDLAALTTRATPTADGFRVSGQKIWSSYASSPADWCLLLARTDPDQPRHRGLSLFLVDMRTPGITVRPIRSMSGVAEFNEIFFDEVEIPRTALLGELNRAWSQVMYGLIHERTGIAFHAGVGRHLESLIGYAQTERADGTRLIDHGDVRRSLAEMYSRYRTARLLSYRIVSLTEEDVESSAEGSAAFIESGLAMQALASVGLEVVGSRGVLEMGEQDAAMDARFLQEWIESIPSTLYAGTVDIQRNIVAQRGLGLPKGI